MSNTTNHNDDGNKNIPMSAKERVCHALIFEIGAVCLSAVVVLLFSDVGAYSALGLGIIMSLMAMLWNFVFNCLFDKVFIKPRQTRGLGVRLLHTISFEGGLLIFTIPVVAYMLKLTLWQALLADVSLTVLITLYALVFNFVYDHWRLKVFAKLGVV